MAESTDEIVARYTPQFEGAHFKNIPKRDLTQADVDRLSPDQRADAFAPHPGYGTPLYTAVEPKAKAAQDKAIAAADKAAPKEGDA